MISKVRFAPSPTGYLHIGGLRTALYNYLYAKKINGKFILRIEDTDQKRKIENAVENLIITFNKIGITFDEGPKLDDKNNPYFQSQRLDIYHQHIDTLIKNGHAYPCFCLSNRLEDMRKEQTKNKQTIKYDRHCLTLDAKDIKEKMDSAPYVIRMKIPSKNEVVFYDMIREKIAINCSEIDDQVLIKSDGYPTYHFANVVDDHLMGITHVMRGEEWLPSTPKHILLYEFFNWDLPKFIHLPLLLNQDKSKLSKRQGDVAVEDYLQKGFLPEAIINFVSLLGWHPKNEKEFFSLEELKKEFSIKRIQKSGAVFDIKKLEWINSHYLRSMDINVIAKLAQPYFDDHKINISDKKKYLAIINYARNRVNTLSEIPLESKIFYNKINISNENLSIINTIMAQKLLKHLFQSLKQKNNYNGDEFKNIVMQIGKKMNLCGKELFQPIRIALYGSPAGPDLPIIFSILGLEETLIRLSKIIIK